MGIGIAALTLIERARKRRPTWSEFPVPPRPMTTTPISQATDIGPIACAGRIVASDEIFESPAGKAVVWYECVIRRQWEDSEGGTQDEIALILRAAGAFEIDDGSAVRLRVVTDRGYLLPDVHSCASERATGILRDRLDALLVNQGKGATGPGVDLLIAETSVALHECVTVQGTLERSAARPYRESGVARPVVCAGRSGLWVWR
jgi:hypothetical protein